jgi:ABC-type ATPase involved in cell division
VLVATHDIELINRLGHRRLILKHGRFEGETRSH